MDDAVLAAQRRIADELERRPLGRTRAALSARSTPLVPAGRMRPHLIGLLHRALGVGGEAAAARD